MDSLASTIHKRSYDIGTLQKQLRELTALQIEALQAQERQKSELSKKLIYPSTISDLEDMLMQDIAWDIPIEYYTQPHPAQSHGGNNPIVYPMTPDTQLHPSVNGTKRSGRCFEAIREQKLTASLPVVDQIDYTIYTFDESSGGARGRAVETATSVRDVVPTYSDFIGTSDRFVAIFNILRQNQEEVRELRRELTECKKTIHSLTHSVKPKRRTDNECDRVSNVSLILG